MVDDRRSEELITLKDEVEGTATSSVPIVGDDDSRVIYCGKDLDAFLATLPEKVKPPAYCNNAITTSKYTLNPFSPWFVVWRNLFEQFHRLANVYFLCIAILQLIPGVSPTGQFTTLIPLLLVMFLSLCKDAFEDYKRHVNDRELNNKKVQALRRGEWSTIRWVDVDVGDILEVNNKESFAADMIMLWTTEPDGLAYIETSSLDGETNLKIRKSCSAAYQRYVPARASDFSCTIVSELPNNRIETYSGTMFLDGARVPLSHECIMLRGAQMRNTEKAYGLVIFTGSETKLMKNSRAKTHKMSNMDTVTNRQVLFIFVFQIILCVLCTVGLGIYNGILKAHWYLAPEDSQSLPVKLISGFATFLILFNNLIPISLYVSMEMVKLIQAYFINCDIEMYHEGTDTPALARTSALNEELGQVSYIFSDKTGTLTCNIMDFMKFSCISSDGKAVSYGEGVTEIARAAALREGRTLVDPRPAGFEGFYDHRITSNQWLKEPNAANLEMLLVHLAVCHTVVVERDEKTGASVYQAASPDEACLVKGAKSLGVEFTDRNETSVMISVAGEGRTFQLLNIIEFNSTRKRMSAIVRDHNGKLMLLCKGADSVLAERLKKDPAQERLIAETTEMLTVYASEGLRTLVIAKADLDEERYAKWAKRYADASCAIVDREEKMAEVGDELEWGLELVGTTAIEDKLQLGVPQTVELLIAAGIKVWVLTGDKQETAINIAYACALLNNSMSVMSFDEVSADNIYENLKELLREAEENEALPNAADKGLVIQGHLLLAVLEEPEVAQVFLKLATKCKAVVCCRVSPLQKAQVVSLVKDFIPQSITLAIGDGANDVSMIQSAHVGIGISGLEGLQAARASDYSIAQFRFLRNLLLVHGRYSYRRISRLILYSFYKNIALYLTQMWFCLFNGFSGQSLVDPWALALYNVWFTAFPIMAVAVLDKDVSADRLLHMDQFPELFLDGLNGRLFHTRVFWVYLFNAVFHSAVCFFGAYFLFDLAVEPGTGKPPDTAATGILVYTAILFVVTGKVALETLSWSWVNVAICAISIAVWFAFIFIYGQFYRIFGLADFAWWYDVPQEFVPTAAFWLIAILLTIGALLRDFTYKYYRRWLRNSELIHVVQVLEHHYAGSQFDRSNVTPNDRHLLRRLENLDPKVGAKTFIAARHETGFAFAQESGQEKTMRVFQQAMVLRKAASKFKSLTSKGRASSPVVAEGSAQKSRSHAASVSSTGGPSMNREAYSDKE